MDPIVEAALRKWPNVPACRGWLGLDARGHWHLRDDACQAAGPFPAARGGRLEHAGLIAFIGRNYAADAQGAWFFQNGPQRVYVELEAAPWVLGVQAQDHPGGRRWALHTHTGLALDAGGAPPQAWLDEHGRLFLDTPLGLGLVRSADMHAAAEALEAGAWPLAEARHAALIARHGLCLSPATAQGAGDGRA